MHQTIAVMQDKWFSSKEAAHILGRSQRTIQKLAAEGVLRWKLAGDKMHPNARLYDPQDLERMLTEPAARHGLNLTEKKTYPSYATPNSAENGVIKRIAQSTKPSQSERALDTVSIVGNLVAGHKAEMEMLMRQFESIVGLVLQSQKAEADAQRERLKAEREDARERWEIERRDRLERYRQLDAV